MKKLFTLIFCVCATTFAIAQKAEMAQATVRYKFSHIRDTTAKDKPYTENMILFVGPTASVYKSFDKKLQDELMRKQAEQQMAEQKGNGGPINIKITNTRSTTRSEIYQFGGINKMMRKESLITPYLIEEPLPAIKWKISGDTASFGSLHCQKATAHFKGRDYTAWFCPDLPFHTGPWKLNGLPGLIVEAYDTNKEVEFKFDGMEQVVPSEKPKAEKLEAPGPGVNVVRIGGMDDPNHDPNLIAVPANAVKTTEKEFKNLQEAMRKDPQAFMAAMGGGMQGKITATGGTKSSFSFSGSGPVNNNPLELPEKK